MTAESDLDFPQVETADETLDEDNRLKADFVRLVLDAVERGDTEEAYRLAQPLHAADIADLFELTAREDRADLAIALGDLLSADVLAEINDWVRDDIVDALPAALPPPDPRSSRPRRRSPSARRGRQSARRAGRRRCRRVPSR